MSDKRKKQENQHDLTWELFKTPIKPGLVLVLVQLEKLFDEDRKSFDILHEWLIETLGRPYLAAYISYCYPSSDHEDYTEEADYFRVPEDFLEILQNAK